MTDLRTDPVNLCEGSKVVILGHRYGYSMLYGIMPRLPM